jgi:hypothetical protein
MDSENEPIWKDYRQRRSPRLAATDKEKLAMWLETYWATAEMAAKHCPDLADRKVKNVAALLEELAAEGTIPVTDIKRANRMGQYTQFTGKHSDKGNDWGEIEPKE